MNTKLTLAVIALATASLFSTVAYGSEQPVIVNVDGLSDECAMRIVGKNFVVICPAKDEELLTKIVNANKETPNDE